MSTWAGIEAEISRVRRLVLEHRKELREAAAREQVSTAEAHQLAQKCVELEQAMAPLIAKSVGASANYVEDILVVRRQVKQLCEEVDTLLQSTTGPGR